MAFTWWVDAIKKVTEMRSGRAHFVMEVFGFELPDYEGLIGPRVQNFLVIRSCYTETLAGG